MFKNFIFFFVLFLLVSCQRSEEEQHLQADDGSGIILPINGDLPYEAFSFDTNLSLINFSPEQEIKLHQATELIKKVMALKEFKDEILNYTYKGENKFIDNGGYSNTQIYQKMLNAAEILSPSKNNILDAEIELYYNTHNTIGYTFPNTRRIWVNTKYFDRYTPVEVAANLYHEWLHKLGFDHAVSWSDARDHSVPYAIGYLLEKYARQIYLSEQ